MPFIKLDPRAPDATINLSSLGGQAGQIVEITLVGDYSGTPNRNNPFSPDINKNIDFFYEGKLVGWFYQGEGSIGRLTIGSSPSLLAVNKDRPLTDNSDPDNDYGALVTIINGPLFTHLGDYVNFRAITAAQQELVAGGWSLYNAGNGSDRVVLPSKSGYQLAPNVTWDPHHLFSAGSGRDTVAGGNGNDRIDGGRDNDVLNGGAGHDFLVGGRGRDVLKGEAGRDRFLFDDKDTGASLSKADYIIDFRGKLGDKLDVSDIDARSDLRGDQKFTFIGEADAFTKAGQVRYEQTKTDTWVFLNTDADKSAEAVIRLKGSFDLSKAWFIL